MIKYQDVSIGKIISEIKSKNGEIKSMCLNPYNAVILTGHSNGCVSMWTPNMGEPVVKFLAHSNSVTSLSVDVYGKNLVTCGSDGKMKIWDLKNYK
jgi:U3 small nucleolar RNA-associated protein 7